LSRALDFRQSFIAAARIAQVEGEPVMRSGIVGVQFERSAKFFFYLARVPWPVIEPNVA
jgi:hypothetical protein